ncbi:MAG: T9SS type A sorting domain-containing protein [Dysgonamonadaceae bacterium]|jgi:hypothetical protein|nr:T9SS type A sorting domain-containing protein [Dysgonamonadaceae bacterium]
MKKLFISLVLFTVFALGVTAQTHSLQSINKNNTVQKVGNHPKIEQKAQALAASLKRQPVFGATTQAQSAKDREAAVNSHAKRFQTAKAAINPSAGTSKTNVSIKKSTNPDAATVTLNVVGDPLGDSTGFQMFLDPDCELDWQQISSYPEFFEICEYRLPSDATSDFATTNVVLDESVSITIPEGTYNLIILYIWISPESEYSLAYPTYWWGDNYSELSAGDGFHFKKGYEYIFTINQYGYAEYNPDYDVALTGLSVPDASFDLTNSEPITVYIANPGAVDFSSVDLSYQINDEAVVTESYNTPIEVGKEYEYTFNAKADLSAGGIYTIKAWLTHDDDMNPRNNIYTATTKKIVPLQLPFLTDFDTQNDLLYWTFTDVSGFTSFYYDLNNVDADGGAGNLQLLRSYETEEGHAFLVSDPLDFTDTKEINVRFQFMPYGKFTLRILYGTTPNPEEMALAAEYPNLNGYLWDFRAVNFTADAPGIYYIAFEYLSAAGIDPDPDDWGEEGETPGGGVMAIDNIIIDKGVFIGIPDLEVVKMVLPASACDMTGESEIAVKVKNVGTEPISDITLSYQINDSEPVEEIIYFETEYWQAYQLGINEEAIVKFAIKADFSAPGEYAIQFVGIATDDKNDENDTFETTLVHYDPVTEFPFVSDFMNPEDRKEWTSTEVDGWLPNTYLGCLWPETEQLPLLSRCMTLSPGKYRFDYSYSAGWEVMGFLLLDDFYVAYGKAGEDPLTWTPVKSYSNKATYGAVIDDDIILEISEAGEYQVAIVSTILGDLAVWRTSVSEVKMHDVRLAKISPINFPRIIPKRQVAGIKTLDVTVTNRGESEETGSIEASIAGQPAGSTTFFVEQNKNVTVPLTVNLTDLPAGDLNLLVAATINGEADAAPEDNTFEFTRVISDSIFAHDSFNAAAGNFLNGFATGDANVRVGLIYELSVQDTLTSATLGFCEQTFNPDFGLSVYPVADNLTIDDALFSLRQPVIAGTSSAYAVPETILPPGKYFFEIQDFSLNSFYIICDLDPDGHFYARTNNTGQLSKIESLGLGYIHLRPNFGVIQSLLDIKKIQATDFNLSVYSRPNSREITVIVPEAATVEIFNVTGTKVAVQQVIKSADFLLKQSGIYVVKAITEKNGNTISKKIVVR